ncbi:MAG: DUF4332 domain-containing protein [Candidatus Sericytochromatia bacterium]|nr:DUF4332 domain-containing protein [Candidatus Sericytochromatia bacterium]
MIFSRSCLAFALLTTSFLTACGSVSSPVATQSSLKTALTVENSLRQNSGSKETVTRSAATTTAKQTTAKQVSPKQTIELKPVSKETVQAQAQLRKSASTAPKQESSTDTSPYSPDEVAALKELEASLAEELQAEDQMQASTQEFGLKSAQQGKDIDIEMFLYNPKYSKSAKFWGIKNANDLLQAGRSPLRRWLLKRKLEGLWAPGGFEQQILFWVEQADLLRITGVSRDDAWLLVANGITSVPDLARRNVVELAAMKLSISILALQYGMDVPSLDDLKAWTEEAKTLQPVIY